MILNGNQRGNAKNMALHLLKEENERVDVHEIRGFVSDNLVGALQESYAISRATQCKQHIYSLSLNPPKSGSPSNSDFKNAIERVEKKLGLDNQPRIIVFHEKRGMDGELRKHAHAVWCRIDTNNMKAIQLSFTHRKLREVSRQLFVTHNWRMPDGLLDSKDRDPRNFSLAEWQQAKRAGKNAKELKALFQDCWALSDSKTAFQSALLEQGFVLAQGKRGHVAVDYQGEVYPVSRWTGLKAKDVRERLGLSDGLPSVDHAQAVAAKIIADRLAILKEQEHQTAKADLQSGEFQKMRIQEKQSHTEVHLHAEQANRKTQEEATRAARIRKGVLGFVDRLTGKRKRIIEENAVEAIAMLDRDRLESEVLNNRNQASLLLHRNKINAAQASHQQAIQELDADITWLKAPPELYSRGEIQKNDEERDNQMRRGNRNRDGPR